MKFILALSALASVIATPVNRVATRQLQEKENYITIHESCNATQRRMLEKGFNDTWEVAEFAQKYTLHNGPEDEVFRLYFGDNIENFAKVLGVWESLLYSDKEGVLFRCDNIDGNCGQEGWRGHWRGDNATSETVICDASYTDRRPNSEMCMFGYDLAGSLEPSTFWSIDLIHRLFHVPKISNGAVQHYKAEGEGLASVFELAAQNSTYAPFDSDVLQYYAMHVYINEVVQGGDSCLGDIESAMNSEDSSSSAASTTTSASTATASAAETTEVADCHTHADGTVHCV